MDFKKWQNDFINYVITNNASTELLSTILPAGELTIIDSLKVYANDYNARLLEAMSKNYEMTWLVLGDEIFLDLAKLYISKYPSSYRSLNDYGDKFPDFLNEHSYSDYSEIANYENSFWRVFHSKENKKKILTEDVIANGIFDLSVLYTFSSMWNFPFLWSRREVGVKDEEADLIHASEVKFWVLFKLEDRVTVLELNRIEYDFLRLLKQNKKIGLVEDELDFNNLEDEELIDWQKILGILSYSEFSI